MRPSLPTTRVTVRPGGAFGLHQSLGRVPPVKRFCLAVPSVLNEPPAPVMCEEELAGLGFCDVLDTTAADLTRRYFTGPNSGRKMYAFLPIAHGTIID